MKITFVIGSVPFPARQGVELPIEKLIRKLAENHSVDLLVVGYNKGARNDFNSRSPNIPTNIKSVKFIQVAKKNRIFALFKDFLLVYPAFFSEESKAHTETISDALKNSDIIWVSPFGNLGTLKTVRQDLGDKSGKIVVGLNDATYGLYGNGFRHLKKRWKYREWRRIFNALRTPWIAFYEWRFLRKVDAVHVQTKLEQQRCERLLKFERQTPSFICKQNGKGNLGKQKKREKSSTPIVLLMTHLSGGRKNESLWFLQEVWPKVTNQLPSAHLQIVGSPPIDIEAYKLTLPKNVQVLGFVDELHHALDSATVGVIPTLHRSGWVNRISDYMGAGLPIVACSEPLSTIQGLEPGKHAHSADTPTEFAAKVIDLLTNPIEAQTLAENGQALAATFPTWDETTEHIEDQLLKLVDS